MSYFNVRCACRGIDSKGFNKAHGKWEIKEKLPIKIAVVWEKVTVHLEGEHVCGEGFPGIKL